MPRSDWELEEFSTLEEFVGTIKDAYFTTAEAFYKTPRQFGEDSVILVLVAEVEKPISPPDWGFDTANLIYSVGRVSQWNLIDNGERIVSVTGRGIQKRSQYGQFIDRVVNSIKVPVVDRGAPTEAFVWKDLRFHFKLEIETITIRDRQTGESREVESRLILPIAWLQDVVPPLRVSSSY